MATQEMLIAGLRTQRENLDILISELVKKKTLSKEDSAAYDSATKRVEKNLRTLRKIVEGKL